MHRRRFKGEEYWLHEGHWVPRSHFYDYGEEPLYMGPGRPRTYRDAFGPLLGLTLLLALVHFSGMGSRLPLLDAAFYPVLAVVWTAFFGLEWLAKHVPVLAVL